MEKLIPRIKEDYCKGRVVSLLPSAHTDYDALALSTQPSTQLAPCLGNPL